jgi:two-component system CheB/CheR fusion protein
VRQLAAADEQKNEFVAMLAHELRNPLAPMRNALDIMKGKSPSDADFVRMRDMLDRQVTKMARIVSDLLEAAKVTRNQLQLRRAPVEVQAVLERSVELLQHATQARRQSLIVSMPEAPMIVSGDATRLEQVFGNLLENAIKFTPEGGRIEIEASIERGSNGEQREVAVSVRDNGIGIPPQVLPRIFDLFVQGRPPGGGGGGLGIGLTIVRSLVALHGGRVEARSEGLGKGAEFAVVLPALADETVALGAPPPQPERASHGGGLQVLVVEDNPDAAESMMMLLEVFGHGVRVAPDGESALEMASGEAPDLMLVDVGLPGIDGYEVARRVREAPALRETTLIALTGFGRDEDRDRARAAGFDHHLLKPVDPDALRRMMARIAEGLRRAP